MSENYDKASSTSKASSPYLKKDQFKSDIKSQDRSKSAVLGFLKQIPSFKDLTAADFNSLAEVSWFATIKAKEYLSFEGDLVNKNCFIVVRGRLAMMKTSRNGRQLIVELLGANDMFGLLAALAAKNILGKKTLEQLTAHAHASTMVLWIPVDALIRTLNNNPQIYPDLVAYLLDHLHSSYRLSRALAHDRVEVRIAAILLTLSDQFARYHNDPQPLIDITRQQLANLAGTTIESAIRVTRGMEAEGILELQRPGEITLILSKKLEQIIDDT
jgi:CRP-like cAMP-binding protein